MNKDQFHQYLKFPDQLNSGSLVELEDLVKEYPYFQAARMLYVKNLKNEENIRFNRQLKFAAACINNRQLLFGLLNSIQIGENGSFIPYPQTEAAGAKKNKGQDVKLVSGERKNITEGILSLTEEDSSQKLSRSGKEASPEYDKSIYVRELERFIPIADLDLLLFDFPGNDTDILDFDFEDKLPDIKNETSLTGQKKEKKLSAPGGVSSRDLISDFIRKNPRMPQLAESGQVTDDISLQSLRESDAFMTETLAEIYLKQGYYYRALQAYEKLSLKNPEKSIYFASQIQKIKELITNQ